MGISISYPGAMVVHLVYLSSQLNYTYRRRRSENENTSFGIRVERRQRLFEEEEVTLHVGSPALQTNTG